MPNDAKRYPIFPGTFDPVTRGHCDIIARGVRLFGGLTVAVLTNAAKNPCFPLEERLAMLQEAINETCPGQPVTVAAYDGLLVRYASQHHALCLLRGVRSAQDYDYEVALAQAHAHLSDPAQLETVFLNANPALAVVSSQMVRHAAAAGYASQFDDQILDAWVTPGVKTCLRRKFKAEC